MFATNSDIDNMRRITAGQSSGSFGQALAQYQQSVTIPMAADNWRKLSRETQLRVLEETGILKAATE